MASSKHPKLLSVAKKKLALAHKIKANLNKEMKRWARDVKKASADVAALELSHSIEIGKYFQLMNDYEDVVHRINALIADLSQSPKDKAKLKELKQAEADADNIRSTIMVLSSNAASLENDAVRASVITQLQSS